MSNARIKPVTSNKNKRRTYALIMEKYKNAMENGYYGEAELIVYAYLEDRLRSFIYYSDGLDHWNSRKINENMISIYGNDKYVEDISAKLDVINKVIDLNKLKKKYSGNDYADYLIKIYSVAFDSGKVKKLIGKINNWRKYRNEVVHALLNKDLDDMHCTFKNHVEEGYLLARELDNYVGMLKRS